MTEGMRLLCDLGSLCGPLAPLYRYFYHGLVEQTSHTLHESLVGHVEESRQAMGAGNWLELRIRRRAMILILKSSREQRVIKDERVLAGSSLPA